MQTETKQQQADTYIKYFVLVNFNINGILTKVVFRKTDSNN